MPAIGYPRLCWAANRLTDWLDRPTALLNKTDFFFILWVHYAIYSQTDIYVLFSFGSLKVCRCFCLNNKNVYLWFPLPSPGPDEINAATISPLDKLLPGIFTTNQWNHIDNEWSVRDGTSGSVEQRSDQYLIY